ncbi:hypothetical protein BDW42DRAFT_74173 [Aspergillus taichungensis]|uniref:Uncharacterized protein n=1 Tax=Aspergillus taichungensis TaxID=482145 RepID=A0A2J5HZF5_9EURO|nr:hypothetical protein BDW42DRAFT_74173 [Aspergillus taichungensis]
MKHGRTRHFSMPLLDRSYRCLVVNPIWICRCFPGCIWCICPASAVHPVIARIGGRGSTGTVLLALHCDHRGWIDGDMKILPVWVVVIFTILDYAALSYSRLMTDFSVYTTILYSGSLDLSPGPGLCTNDGRLWGMDTVDTLVLSLLLFLLSDV